MDSMVERIAQTLRISLHLASEREREAADRAAVAVLRTMMEPTFEIIQAGMNTKDNGDGQLHRRKWRAMLQAALHGDQEG